MGLFGESHSWGLGCHCDAIHNSRDEEEEAIPSTVKVVDPSQSPVKYVGMQFCIFRELLITQIRMILCCIELEVVEADTVLQILASFPDSPFLNSTFGGAWFVTPCGLYKRIEPPGPGQCNEHFDPAHAYNSLEAG